MKALLSFALAPLVVACSYNGSFMPSFMDGAPVEPTLAELQPVALPQQRSELPVFNLDQLEQTWRQVLLVTSDPKIRLQALHRLADIELDLG